MRASGTLVETDEYLGDVASNREIGGEIVQVNESRKCSFEE